jgi:hypothetical protein
VRSLSLLFALPLLLALGTAGPAVAEQVTVRDQVHDVFTPRDGSLFGYDRVGTAVNTDLRSTRVRFRGGVVTVRATFVDLRRGGSNETDVTALLRTRSGRFLVFAYVHDDLSLDVVSVFRLVGDHGYGGTQGVLDCPGAHGSTSARADTVSFSVPADCLGGARSVRYQGSVVTYADAGILEDSADGRSPKPRHYTPPIHDTP